MAPAKPGVPRSASGVPRCNFEGCTKQSVGPTGFCVGHGGGRRCKYPGCGKGAQSSGNRNFCRTHGGGGRCKSEGCGKVDAGGGLCRLHGGGRRCQIESCTKADVGGGFCMKHGGGRRCHTPGCVHGAQSGGKYCKSHGGGRRCTFQGCTSGAQGGGSNRCIRHGGGKHCQVEGCTSAVRRGSHCSLHLPRANDAHPEAAPALALLSEAGDIVTSGPASSVPPAPTRQKSSVIPPVSVSMKPQLRLDHHISVPNLNGVKTSYSPPRRAPPSPISVLAVPSMSTSIRPQSSMLSGGGGCCSGRGGSMSSMISTGPSSSMDRSHMLDFSPHASSRMDTSANMGWGGASLWGPPADHHVPIHAPVPTPSPPASSYKASVFISLSIPSMMCMENCGETVRRCLERQPGVLSVTVHFPTRTATVQVDPSADVHVSTLIKALDQCSFASNCISSTSTSQKSNMNQSENLWDIAEALGLVDPGCPMAWGGICSCSPDSCRCVNCREHHMRLEGDVDESMYHQMDNDNGHQRSPSMSGRRGLESD